MSLHGVRVAVTRTAAQASELIRLLEDEGARIAAHPLIRVHAHDAVELARTVRDGSWDWIVFTSVNAVRFTVEALQVHGRSTIGTLLRAARVACVGPATAQAAQQAGLAVTTIPEPFVGAAVVDAMTAAHDLRGARVLWPRGEAAADSLAEALRTAGAVVAAPVAYRTLADPAGAGLLATAILQGDIDVVTFTSPSAVRSLASALPAPIPSRVAVIGPVTAEAARAAGYAVDAVAAEHTAAGLVEALRGLYR